MPDRRYRAATAGPTWPSSSRPAAAVENVERWRRCGVPSWCGTTGWLDDGPRARNAVERTASGLVVEPNFSVGVNVFTRAGGGSGAAARRRAGVRAWAWEIHHSTKKDAPSGTLLKLVESMKSGGIHPHDRCQLQPRRRASRHARNRFRLGRRHDHAAPHRPQPRRVRTRGAESGAMDSGQAGRLRVQLRFCSGGKTRMFTGCGTALVTPFRQRSVAG